MMAKLKVPLIATGVAFVLMIVIGIFSITVIYKSSGSNRKKSQQAAMAGSAVATIGCIAIAPFWLYAAAKIGQERRQNKSGKKPA